MPKPSGEFFRIVATHCRTRVGIYAGPRTAAASFSALQETGGQNGAAKFSSTVFPLAKRPACERRRGRRCALAIKGGAVEISAVKAWN
jgi:hypothetical protein